MISTISKLFDKEYNVPKNPLDQEKDARSGLFGDLNTVVNVRGTAPTMNNNQHR